MPPADFVVRPATVADLPAIDAIFNREILKGVATWDSVPWTAEARRVWFDAHQRQGEAVFVAATPDGTVAGFSHLSFYSPRAAYWTTRTDSVYIDPAYQRRGVGRLLVTAVLEEARRTGAHLVLAGIDSENAASIALHAGLGFAVMSRLPEAGRKFEAWRTLVQMGILLG
ncbi:MAG: N-acetyltransferase family protein [Dehalococcoidia bacterium]|nr:MAG: N-acetyltransferase family protein [Dehalococcoidia bacterium]